MSKHICVVCNTTCRSAYDLRQHFQTPKHLKNEEKEQEDQEKQKDLIIQQKDIEIMKLKAQLETTTTMYTMLLNTLNNKPMDIKPMDIKPLEQKSAEKKSNEDTFEGFPFIHATEQLTQDIEQCDASLFKLDHNEEEQELSIVNLRQTHIDYTNFPLYDLYCDVRSCQSYEELTKIMLDYFMNLFSKEDYKGYNKTTTDRIFFGDTNGKWLSCSRSTTLLDELILNTKGKLLDFDKNVYQPLKVKYDNKPQKKLLILMSEFNVQKLIYSLLKNK